jgi:hypothetical protein
MAKTAVVKDLEEGKDVSKEETKPEPVLKVKFSEMFRFADKLDAVLLVFGIINSVVAGVVMPLFSVIFGVSCAYFSSDNCCYIGDLLEEINQPNPEDAADGVLNVSYYFVYLAVLCIVSGFCQFAFFCWRWEK